MAGNAVSCGHDDDAGKAFDLLASVVRFPDRHDPESVAWLVSVTRPPVFRVGRYVGFAVVMARVQAVPFRTRKLRPGCGDGTASEGGRREMAHPPQAPASRRTLPVSPSCRVPEVTLYLLGQGMGRRGFLVAAAGGVWQSRWGPQFQRTY